MSWSKEKKNEWRKKKVASGLCGICGTRPLVTALECEECRVKRTSQHRDYYKHNADKWRDRSKKRSDAGLCNRCGKNNPKTGHKSCETCLEKHRERHQARKDKVYAAYGGYICNCCGETMKEFLMIDHVKNDGADHRRTLKPGDKASLYSWLIRNNFPEGFQVLCANCNWGKRIYGVCPHKLQPAAVTAL